jgi:hypothetical protein
MPHSALAETTLDWGLHLTDVLVFDGFDAGAGEDLQAEVAPASTIAA